MITKNVELKDINTEVLDRLPELLDCDVKEILFIDIETTGLSPKDSEIYMIGAAYCDGTNWQIRQLFAENPSEEEEVLSAFSDFCRHYKVLIHYNGDRFDIPFMQNRYEKHKLTCPVSNIRSADLYKRIKPYKKLLGLADCKQKTIETFLGINRDDQYGGGELIMAYDDYVTTTDSALLEVLLLHNFEDVKGLMDLLPILKYETFFDLFRNLPKISVRTDEEIKESDYVAKTEKDADSQDAAADTSEQTDKSFLLPARAVKVQANKYKDMDGIEKKEVYMKLSLPISLPAPITGNGDGCYFRVKEDEAVVRVPLIEEELKYFYANYKDYYYLPQEDMAIHKNLAEFVDKDFKEKAKPENCYTKKEGQYLMEWDLVFSPFFKKDYEDKNLYFDLNDTMKKSRFAMSLYACHVMAHVLDL
jgi:uncharacterized protein YprB with RNaseH-like and TPR domain